MLVDTWLWWETLHLGMSWAVAETVQTAVGAVCFWELEKPEGHERRLLAGVASSSQMWGDQLFFCVCFILLLWSCCWSWLHGVVSERRGVATGGDEPVESCVEKEGDMCAGMVSRHRPSAHGGGEEDFAPCWAWEVVTGLKSQVVQSWGDGFFVGVQLSVHGSRRVPKDGKCVPDLLWAGSAPCTQEWLHVSSANLGGHLVRELMYCSLTPTCEFVQERQSLQNLLAKKMPLFPRSIEEFVAFKIQHSWGSNKPSFWTLMLLLSFLCPSFSGNPER